MMWDRVKLLIKQNNTTQEWVANRIGKPRESFARWLSANRIPEANYVYEIAKLFSVTVEYLLEGEAGDAYVRGVLGIPDIPLARRKAIKRFLELPDKEFFEMADHIEVKHSHLGTAELHA